MRQPLAKTLKVGAVAPPIFLVSIISTLTDLMKLSRRFLALGLCSCGQKLIRDSRNLVVVCKLHTFSTAFSTSVGDLVVSLVMPKR